MRLLTAKDSWNLLCERVIGEKHSCSPQLEEAGKENAKKCEGLPLAIIAIAKHLSKAEKTPEYWSNVAEKECSNIIGADAEMSKALYLSYNILDNHLKACFVYMGVFPLDMRSLPPSSSTCAPTEKLKPASSILSFSIYASKRLARIRLLRVLDALTIRFYGFPTELVKLIRLRYLSFTYNGKLPASISKLCNLEYLIVHQYLSIRSSRAHHSNLPMEIWDMKQLRHLQVMGSDLPDPTPEYACLPNLLTLLGPEWEFSEEEFERLQFLLIEDTDLEYWRVDHTHFPCLRRLFIHHCYKLKEIPLEIGEIPGLEMVEIADGSPSLVDSAKQIQEEQHNWGNNYGVQVELSRLASSRVGSHSSSARARAYRARAEPARARALGELELELFRFCS
ncbi:UNVERIFIED_CONTAM: hypothetical protein Sradi_2908300 [Sesamum radiatum]|uniref:NB-ARC domain-containing protein n=1 Tax=Sesamum radiatum TaxID=300843 RepID=A0AAW2RZ97_SESRA